MTTLRKKMGGLLGIAVYAALFVGALSIEVLTLTSAYQLAA
jgi:hypothetical protein